MRGWGAVMVERGGVRVRQGCSSCREAGKLGCAADAEHSSGLGGAGAVAWPQTCLPTLNTYLTTNGHLVHLAWLQTVHIHCPPPPGVRSLPLAYLLHARVALTGAATQEMLGALPQLQQLSVVFQPGEVDAADGVSVPCMLCWLAHAMVCLCDWPSVLVTIVACHCGTCKPIHSCMP
jgi:hypothetical protein